jgi:hypothetical protein
MLKGDLPPELFDQLDEAIRGGYPTIKMFTTNSRPRWPDYTPALRRAITVMANTRDPERAIELLQPA